MDSKGINIVMTLGQKYNFFQRDALISTIYFSILFPAMNN